MDFRGDERGQPVVIGALLIFAILILAFSGYQAFVVPNQNADVEFSHSQQVQDDMVDLRIAIVKTAIGDSNTSTGVTLGTRYPSRLIALNPPPPSGTLRTTEPGDIVVNPGQGNRDIDPCPGPDTTRAFVYSPDYNEFSEEAPLVYENTVTYSQHRNSGETKEVLKTSQQIVDVEAGIIRIIALQGEYSESGTQRVNVDFIRGQRTAQDVQDPEITLPTQIMNQGTWEEILEGNPSIQLHGESVTFQYDGTFEVRCTQVGTNREPGSTDGGSEATPTPTPGPGQGGP